MKKRLASAALCCVLPLTATAESDITVGGAVRFQYSVEDYDEGNRQRVGDIDLDTVRINFDGSVDNILLSAELRYYEYMEVVHHAWLGYQINPEWQVQLGITQLPFGNLPYNSHSFFFSSNYYLGLEDDYDFGIKFLYQGEHLESQIALFKNDEQGGIDGYVDNRSDRYSYDIVGSRQAGQGIYDAPSASGALAETNTLVWRVASDLLDQPNDSLQVGFSALHGQLHDDQETSAGDYSAFALHMNGQFGAWNLQLTSGHYEYNPDDGSELMVVGAYSFFDTIAASADIHSANIAYRFDAPVDGIDAITVYLDNSVVSGKSADLDDTRMHVLGASVSKGSLFTYIDLIHGENQPFIGSSMAANAGNSNTRFNINVGFYF